MSKQISKVVEDAMTALNLEYGFGVYSGDSTDLYFVGEYTEEEPMNEDGMQETAFLLTGFSRGTWLTLENAKERIANYFNKVSGKTVMADDGSAVAVFYASALIVPTGDAELKRIQINLHCKEWSVN